MGVKAPQSSDNHNLKIDARNVSNSENAAAVYDIICHYKEDNEEDNNNTVPAVIENIEKGSYKRHEPTHRKWMFLRLVGCMLIIILLLSPVYGFVTLYVHHKELLENGCIILIWAPVIFNASYLFVTPWLFPNSTLSSLSNRTIIILSTLIITFAISISNFLFIYFNESFSLLIVLLYGFIGGKRYLSEHFNGKFFYRFHSIFFQRLHFLSCVSRIF